jgi:hypothetical protein
MFNVKRCIVHLFVLLLDIQKIVLCAAEASEIYSPDSDFDAAQC